MDPVALPEIAAPDFSLIALFLRADPIIQAVMGILLICSVWSWAIAIDKWLGLGGAKGRAKKIENQFWSGTPIEEMGERGVSEKGADAMARVVTAGTRELRDLRRGSVASESQVNMIVERARAQMGVAVGRETARLEGGLSTLAIVASATPFIGLFGTVIGIMNSFRDIAARGETNLTVVAPGIAEALFATAMGLAAAIPALIFYNIFSSDVAKFAERLELFAQEFVVRLSRRLTDRRDD